MMKASQILVRSVVLAACAAAFAGCGQRGPLYLPSAPQAAQRATLPQTLTPGSSASPTPQPPASAASAAP
ncbi:MAG: lipoprotein [Acidovorax sp.]|uniref:LPS translocon maturation chaperone LptM n=1 Tax=Acidovorax sp. TaxID=1872122 RepID=UPI0025C0FE1B|nr:lipoprotein [Acidovorax sp.]MCE1191479.1 lipoprotein [Acidovorax sp.]